MDLEYTFDDATFGWAQTAVVTPTPKPHISNARGLDIGQRTGIATILEIILTISFDSPYQCILHCGQTRSISRNAATPGYKGASRNNLRLYVSYTPYVKSK